MHMQSWGPTKFATAAEMANVALMVATMVGKERKRREDALLRGEQGRIHSPFSSTAGREWRVGRGAGKMKGG